MLTTTQTFPLASFSALAPGDSYTTLQDRIATWAHAFELWIDSRPSENTRRAYRKSWDLFLAFTNKLPWEITKADLLDWLAELRLASLAESTIRQRLAAISSFYTYTTRTYTRLDHAGAERPLYHFNPAQAIPRPKASPYEHACYLSVAETRALLHAIPQTTLQGQRDYALILAYLLTSRRNSEIRLLRFGDFEQAGLAIWYRWTGKGKSRRDECPASVWTSIRSYLRLAGRLETSAPSDYIFTPLTDTATRLPNVDSARWSRNRPLSARQVNCLLKKYARRAGLDPSRIHIHTLRHTAAMLRKEAGDRAEEISRLLAHSNLATTQIYLHHIEGRQDTTWTRVEALLGLPAQPEPQP